MNDRLLDYSTALKRRWLYLAVGAFCLLLMGFVYGWSILAVPLQEEFAWTSAQVALVWMASMALFCFGGLVGSQITRRFSPRTTIVLAAVLLAGGYLVSSLVGSDGLGVLTVAYGAFVGGSTGMAHNATLSTVNRWFPDKIGLSSGLLTLGFGLGSLAIGSVAGLGIDALGWRWSFRLIGLVTACVMFGASLCLRVPAQGQQLPPAVTVRHGGVRAGEESVGSLGSASSGVRAGKEGVGAPGSAPGSASGGVSGGVRAKRKRAVIEDRDYTMRQMLHQKSFYLTFFWTVLMAAVYLSVMGNAKQISLEVGAGMQLATFMVGFISLFDGVGRLSSGLFFDRFGYRPALIGISILYLLASTLLFLAVALTALPVVFVAYLLVGLGFGSVCTVVAAITIRFYGQKNYGSNLAMAYMDFVPASIMGPPLMGIIETTTGSFRYGFALMLAVSLLSLFAALIIRPPRYK